MGTIVQSERDIDAFMAHTKPPVHLLLDTGHARWGGSNPVTLASAYRERIGHVHCKDVREAKMRKSNAGDWSFLDSILGVGADLGVYTVPGDGVVDYAAVFKALRGYSGWLVLEAEQDPKKAPPLPYAKKGVAHMLAALKAADLH
jgi:inosose dehydratase